MPFQPDSLGGTRGWPLITPTSCEPASAAPEVEAAPEAVPEAEAEAVPEAEPEAEIVPEAEAVAEAEAVPEPEAQVVPEVEAVPEATEEPPVPSTAEEQGQPSAHPVLPASWAPGQDEWWGTSRELTT